MGERSSVFFANFSRQVTVRHAFGVTGCTCLYGCLGKNTLIERTALLFAGLTPIRLFQSCLRAAPLVSLPTSGL